MCSSRGRVNYSPPIAGVAYSRRLVYVRKFTFVTAMDEHTASLQTCYNAFPDHSLKSREWNKFGTENLGRSDVTEREIKRFGGEKRSGRASKNYSQHVTLDAYCVMPMPLLSIIPTVCGGPNVASSLLTHSQSHSQSLKLPK